MTQLGLLITLVLGFMLLVLPRRFAVLPMVASAFFITFGQIIIVAGLHFYALRVILLFGVIRIIIRGEFIFLRTLNIIDKLVIIYAGVSFIALFRNTDVFIGQLGFTFNIFSIYFLFRALICDFEDIERVIKIIAIFVVPLAVMMIIEMFTGRNFFYVFGGVPELSMIREGHVRCQGSFMTPITAGSLGSGLFPLFIGLLANQTNRKAWVVLAILASVTIIIASHSSGPAMSFGCGLIGLFIWFRRRNMHFIRRVILFTLILLHLLMKAPVWYLISRVGDLIGGGGYHRSLLIDKAIQYFNEWWLFGTNSTAHWMPYVLGIDGQSDITNQFISEGINGGLLRLFLFITIIVICFRTIGSYIRRVENKSDLSPFFIWSIGVSLLAHMTSFFSVTYFDQIIVFWYMIWAFIASIQSLNQTCDFKV